MSYRIIPNVRVQEKKDHNKTLEYSQCSNPGIPTGFADSSVIDVGDTYYALGISSEWVSCFLVFTSKEPMN